MALIFYDNAVTKILQANINIVGAVNVCLTNNAFNQANSINSDITLSTNTTAVRMTNPSLVLTSGNVVWSGDMVTFTATGNAYAANAVFYADTVPRYLIAFYTLSNANSLAVNDTFSIFCNQGLANIGDPNN